MKISTRGRYGLLAMFNLAVQYDGEPVRLLGIADRYEISTSYLEQVFSYLRKAGLIRSHKGSNGGYLLAKHPAEITVGDILRVLEGNLFEVPVEEAGAFCMKDSLEYCLKKEVWEKIDDSIKSVVDNITLEDLVKENQLIREAFSYMPNL